MRRRRAVRSALLAVVLATGVIVGLLGMHALDVHGTVHAGVAAHGPAAGVHDAPVHVAAAGAHGPAAGTHAEYGSVSADALAAAQPSGGGHVIGYGSGSASAPALAAVAGFGPFALSEDGPVLRSGSTPGSELRPLVGSGPAPSSGGALLSSSGCADCDAGGGMWAAACVLALLSGLLLLLVPRAHRWLHPALSRLPSREVFADAAFPRPPSLIVLCISRT